MSNSASARKRKSSATPEGTKRGKTEKSTTPNSQASELSRVTPPHERGSAFHKKGSIFRVQLHNFMTYDNAQFYPGPQMNYVIGPNGTGKSSIVCALCMGLNGSAKLLGRGDNMTRVVRRSYSTNEKDSNNFWTVNGKQQTGKQIDALVKDELNIRLDNLNNFLPQDKVADFTRQNSLQRLKTTQEAVGRNDLVDMQDRLKKMYDTLSDKQKTQETLTADKDKLKQQNDKVQGEVDRFNETERRKQEKELMEIKLAYMQAEQSNWACKKLEEEVEKAKNDASKAREELSQLKSPMRAKKEEMDKAKQRSSESKKECTIAEQKFEAETNAVDEIYSLVDGKKFEKKRIEKDRSELEARITRWQNERRDMVVKLNTVDEQFAECRGDPKKLIEELKKEYANAKGARGGAEQQKEDHRSQKEVEQQDIARTTSELNRLLKQGDKKVEHLRINRYLQEEYTMYTAVQEHARFRGTVYGPIMKELDVEHQYRHMVEAAIGESMMRTFVVENEEDKTTIINMSRQMKYKGFKVKVATNRQFSAPVDLTSRSSDAKVLKDSGVIGWLDDYLQCPDPVRNVLRTWNNIHKQVVVGDGADTDTIFNRFARAGINVIVSKMTLFNGQNSRYAGGLSTSTNQLYERYRFLCDSSSSNQAAIQELQRKIEVLKENQTTLDEKAQKADIQIQRWTKKMKEVSDTITGHKNLPKFRKNIEDKIAKVDADLEKWSGQLDVTAALERVDRDIVKLEKRKVKHLLIMPGLLEGLQKLVAEKMVVDQEILALSKELTDMNGAVIQQERTVKALTDTEEGKRKRVEIKQRESKERLKAAKDKGPLTEDVKQKIAAVMTKLKMQLNKDEEPDTDDVETYVETLGNQCESMYANNPNLLKEFEMRKRVIAEMTVELDQITRGNEILKTDLEKTRNEWVSQVRMYVTKLNEAFGVCMVDMGFKGEVVLVENDDYSKWGLELKVAYHQEELQSLDNGVQSGGEKSLATIMYLAAMQGLTECPIRVVDEINQGMDENRERAVFGYVAQSSVRRNDLPQNFMISQKVVTGLEYPPGVTVLLIYNGPHNCEQAELEKHSIGVPVQ